MQKIPVGDSAILELAPLIDARTGTRVTGAVVTATVKTAAGVNVVASGITWPLTLDEIEPGRYRTVLPPTLTVVAGTQYVVHVTAVKSGLSRTFEEPLLAIVE